MKHTQGGDPEGSPPPVSMNEQEKQALVTSLRLLAATPKSRKVLQKKLDQKGYAEEVVRKTLTQLENQGLLNDRSLAQSLFQTLSSYRGEGRKRIAFEMQKRGIGNDLIQEFLKKYSFDDEHSKALELARDRQERWKRIDRTKRRKKIYDFLCRRGFDFALSREVMSEIENEITNP